MRNFDAYNKSSMGITRWSARPRSFTRHTEKAALPRGIRGRGEVVRPCPREQRVDYDVIGWTVWLEVLSDTL